MSYREDLRSFKFSGLELSIEAGTSCQSSSYSAIFPTMIDGAASALYAMDTSSSNPRLANHYAMQAGKYTAWTNCT